MLFVFVHNLLINYIVKFNKTKIKIILWLHQAFSYYSIRQHFWLLWHWNINFLYENFTNSCDVAKIFMIFQFFSKNKIAVNLHIFFPKQWNLSYPFSLLFQQIQIDFIALNVAYQYQYLKTLSKFHNNW